MQVLIDRTTYQAVEIFPERIHLLGRCELSIAPGLEAAIKLLLPLFGWHLHALWQLFSDLFPCFGEVPHRLSRDIVASDAQGALVGSVVIATDEKDMRLNLRELDRRILLSEAFLDFCAPASIRESSSAVDRCEARSIFSP